MAAATNETVVDIAAFMAGLTPAYDSLYDVVAAATLSFFANITTVVVSGLDDTYNTVVLNKDANLAKYYLNVTTPPTITHDSETAYVVLGAGKLVKTF